MLPFVLPRLSCPQNLTQIAVCSLFLCNSLETEVMKREAGVKSELLIDLTARRVASRMSRHNQQRSVEEGRTLLGDTHPMKRVKPSVDILEGPSTDVNVGDFAPHLIHKWLNESRQSPSCMLGGLG